MEQLISERGAEPANAPDYEFEPAQERRTERSKRSAPPKRIGLHSQEERRQELLRAFDQLKTSEQVRREQQFYERLLDLSDTEADRDRHWESTFAPRLRYVAEHGRTYTQRPVPPGHAA
jgi:hypothetical protein